MALPLSDINLQCFRGNVDNGNPLVLNITETTLGVDPLLVNSYFRCNSAPLIETGDPWCDYVIDGDEVIYLPNERCGVFTPQVCDFSQLINNIPQSQSEFGCSNILETTNDTWGQYNDYCVNSVQVSIPNVYDQVCCYAFSIDQFDIYDDSLVSNNVINGVRVY